MKELIISLDYELRWGMDIIYGESDDSSSIHIKNTPYVIKDMLNLFNKYKVKSTWASVLAISMDSWGEYYETLSEYNIDTDLSHYGHTSKFHNDSRYEKYYFSKDSFYNIINCHYAELGSHSFRHTYFGENNYCKDDFILDNKICTEILINKFNINKYCYVFPRNQVIYEEYFDKAHIFGYRDIPNSYGYKNTTSLKNNSFLSRSSRILNDVFPYTSSVSEKKSFSTVGDIHLRFNLPECFWKIVLKKIDLILGKDNFKDSSSIHLWWHPHNISIFPERNLSRMEDLLILIDKHIKAKNVKTSFMSDVV